MRAHIERLAAWWALAAGVVLLAIVLVTAANAGAFALDRLARLAGSGFPGLPGYEDFVRLAIGCAALMCLPYCQVRRGHVAVDLLAARASPAVRLALERTALVGTVAVAVFLAGWMAAGMAETRADHALSRVLGWPEWPFYLPGVVSLLLWGAVAAAQLPGDRDGG